jgi:hypothetical protein
VNPVKTRECDKKAAADSSPGGNAFRSGCEPIHAQDIGKGAWPAFCRWLTANLSGVNTTIVRDEGSDNPMLECQERPLESLQAVVLPNGVNAVKVSVRIDHQSHVFEAPGPEWLRLHYNAAGFVKTVEIGHADGKMTLHFTGSPAPGAVFTENSWGE